MDIHSLLCDDDYLQSIHALNHSHFHEYPEQQVSLVLWLQTIRKQFDLGLQRRSLAFIDIFHSELDIQESIL